MAITVYNGDRFPFYDLIHKYMKWTEISQYSQMVSLIIYRENIIMDVIL
jgi:hypothetical protein